MGLERYASKVFPSLECVVRRRAPSFVQRETYNRLTGLAQQCTQDSSLSLARSLQKVNGFQKNKKHTYTH